MEVAVLLIYVRFNSMLNVLDALMNIGFNNGKWKLLCRKSFFFEQSVDNGDRVSNEKKRMLKEWWENLEHAKNIHDLL